MHQGRRSPPIFLDLSPRAGQGGDVRCVYKTFTLNTIGYLFNNDMRRAIRPYRPYVRISPGISICYPALDETVHRMSHAHPHLLVFVTRCSLATQGFTSTSLYNH